MGGVFSTNVITSKQVMTAINTVTINNIAQCTGDTSIIQNVTFGGDHNTIKDVLITQSVITNMQCFSNTSNQIKLTNDLAAKITNTANNDHKTFFGVSISGNFISNTAVQTIIQNHVINTIQKCSLNTTYQQNVDFTGTYTCNL